jgi:hypothetical protein
VSVVEYQPRAMAAPSRAWVELLPVAVELAKAVADTEFVPKQLRHNPAAIAACILYGDEVGLGPMQSLAKIAMVDGKPTLFAEAQRGLVLSRGHEMWIEENSNTRVTWAGRRSSSDLIIRATWTLDDAKQAGLAGKHNWKSYPRQMLSARASADLVRLLFADVTGGLAAAEEFDAGEQRPEILSPDPGAPSVARRRRARSASSTLGVGPPAARPAPRVVEADTVGPPLPHEEGFEQVDPLTQAQQSKMQALFRERGISLRTKRLEYATEIIGRPIASSRQLSRSEASKVIDRLEQEVQPPIPDDGTRIIDTQQSGAAAAPKPEEES